MKYCIYTTCVAYRYMYSGTSLIRTPLGQTKVSLLVRCPDFRGCDVHKQETAKCVLFIEVSLFQGCPE